MPSLHEYRQTIQEIAGGFEQIFLVVDALDECKNNSTSLSTLLSSIFKLQRSCKINIFATSRPLMHIVNEFKDAISLEISAGEDDIRPYLISRMPELAAFVQRDLQLQKSITESI